MIFMANKEGLTGHAASVELRANDNGPAARPKPKPEKVPAAPRLRRNKSERRSTKSERRRTRPPCFGSAFFRISCFVFRIPVMTIRPNIRAMSGYVPGEQFKRPRHRQAQHQREPVPAQPARL